MNTNKPSQINIQQAFEAIKQDTQSWRNFFESVTNHQSAPSIIFSLITSIGLYMVESYKVFSIVDPKAAQQMNSFVEPFVAIRNRMKLLSKPQTPINETASELIDIVERQNDFYMNLHSGAVLRVLKRAIQPDLGLYLCDGHIFFSTHMIEFELGPDFNNSQKNKELGELAGAYIAGLHRAFGFPEPEPTNLKLFELSLENRDIKHKSLYGRGLIKNVSPELAMGLSILLASLNRAKFIVQNIFPNDNQTEFTLKFITAYRVNLNLTQMQSVLYQDNVMTAELKELFKILLGNPDSRWLKKQSSLRNMLVHYLFDETKINSASISLDRMQNIELLSRKPYEEVQRIVDRHIDRMVEALEEAFSLSGDPFWYGKVS